MTNVQNSTIRALEDSEIDLVTGGIIGGCITLGTITPFSPIPPTSPWFDPTWVLVGKTGSLPR